METISEEMEQLAIEIERYFERRERDDGTTFYCLGDDAPAYMNTIIMKVHDGTLPDDHIYETIYFALDHIEEGFYVTDSASEFADHYEDNPTLLDWVRSDLSRMEYVDRAMQEFGCDTLSDALGWGYYREQEEIFFRLVQEMEEYTFKVA